MRTGHKGHPDCPYSSKAECDRARRQALGPCVSMVEEDRQCSRWAVDLFDGRGYCGLIAGAKFEPIEKAGHFPHLEQPEQFASRVLAFADAAAPSAPRARRA